MAGAIGEGRLVVETATHFTTASDGRERATGFSVTLMGADTKTQGIVSCDQTRTIDARARTFRKIETAPAAVVQEALDAVRSILE